LGGAAAILIGVMALFAIALPVLLIGGALIAGIGSVALRDPGSVGPWLVLVVLVVPVLWFLLRFFLPAFFEISGLQGPFGSRLHTLNRLDGVAVVLARLRVLRADIGALRRGWRG